MKKPCADGWRRGDVDTVLLRYFRFVKTYYAGRRGQNLSNVKTRLHDVARYPLLQTIILCLRLRRLDFSEGDGPYVLAHQSSKNEALDRYSKSRRTHHYLKETQRRDGRSAFVLLLHFLTPRRARLYRRLRVEERVFLIYFLHYYRAIKALFLPALRGRTVLFINEFSPLRMALLAASEAAGAGRVYVQFNYVLYDRVPGRFDGFWVINDAGRDVARTAGMRPEDVRVWIKAAQVPLRVPVIDRPLRMGFITNNFTNRIRIEPLARDVMARFRPESLVLRPHPNDREEWPGLEVSRAGDIFDFARSCDIVFAGNTAAQVECILAGTPVIHLDGMDREAFDFYGFVASGLIYGARRLEDTDIHMAVRHYCGVEHRRALDAILQSEAIRPLGPQNAEDSPG